MRGSIAALMSATAVAAALALPAHAADMRQPLRQPLRYPVKAPPPPPAWSWAGFYGGVHIGGVEAREDFLTTASAGGVFANPVNLAAFGDSGSGQARASGAIGGVQAGYNWQFGTLVTGVEADISALSVEPSLSGTGPILIGPFAGVLHTTSTSARAEWLATVRGRAGVALDPVLLYVTGGLAMTQLRHDAAFINETPIPDIGSHSETRLVPGFVAGGGIEVALGGNWSAKAEYLYAQFAESTIGWGFDFAGNFAPNPMTTRERLTMQIGRVGVNYRFGEFGGSWPAAAAAAPMYGNPMPTKAKYVKALPPALAHDWSGVYVGANVGWARTEADFLTRHFPGIFFNPVNLAAFANGGIGVASHEGFAGGGQIGANAQWGALVVGIEADLTAFEGSATLARIAPIPTLPTSTFAVTSTASTAWLLTVRPRVGVAFDRALIYGTGGLAVARVRSHGTFADNTPPPPDDGDGQSESTVGGWTAGGGLEYALARGWSMKAEYLYTRLSPGYLDYPTSFPGNVGVQPRVQVSDTLTLQTARVGVNYKFGGPVVAKY